MVDDSIFSRTERRCWFADKFATGDQDGNHDDDTIQSTIPHGLCLSHSLRRYFTIKFHKYEFQESEMARNAITDTLE